MRFLLHVREGEYPSGGASNDQVCSDRGSPARARSGTVIPSSEPSSKPDNHVASGHCSKYTPILESPLCRRLQCLMAPGAVTITVTIRSLYFVIVTATLILAV